MIPEREGESSLFTPTQQQTLHAVVDRIIPGDEFPSGWEAGVGDYLFRQLRGDLRLSLATYRDGLDALDAEAQAAFTSPFASLTPEQQDLLLTRADFGSPALANPGLTQGFFRMLVAHTAEGYYSDPGNGGNRDQAAWKMIGFAVSDGQEAGR